MLLINQRLDKLAAARIDFKNRGMLDGTCLGDALENLGIYLFCLLFINHFSDNL